MQPESNHLHLVRRVAAKETTLFFASPVAYLFLAAFAAVTLFVFFWGEAFFSRNIADVRPLFEWMPVLLIFLASTLTMRLWSEERRTGTLEHVLTQPAPLWCFVLGKFLGCLMLLLAALLVTLPLPVTVAILGNLDWGPVGAGYLATFLLGAAYLSIGLFVSARSNNQIVSLITAVAVCGAFYMIGTATLTELVGNRGGEFLRLLGTGSRFDAITRGMIDLRDLYYYISIIAVFLALNTYVLERERWPDTRRTPHHRGWRNITLLLVVNAVAANLWLGQINALRVDTTEGNIYSISDATRGYLDRLQEPLLLRGYFSSKTHPLLAPLVPQLCDLLREYQIAGGDDVKVEIVDPVREPELEEEANRKYGIEPVPFQVADRYESSIVSSYFNILVQYGDQYEVLGFSDLIEVKANRESDLEVRLRNPEYDLTRAIKSVLHSYQAGGNLFQTVQGDLTFTGYVSDDSQLPPQLSEFKAVLRSVLAEEQEKAGGRFEFEFVDPEAGGGEAATRIARDYGFQPMSTGLFSDDSFYFYMVLKGKEQAVQIPLDDLSRDSFRRNLEAGIKRFAAGFTKTVALVTPAEPSPYESYGMPPTGPRFRQLESFLGAELNVKAEDLSDGSVAGDADILLLASPRNLGEKELFAVDQFLMKGGTVIAATSPFSANLSRRSLGLEKVDGGLQEWLAHQGLEIGEQLVMDPQNAAFPVPVSRDVGGYQVQEIRMMDYPYFVDVREDGLAQDSPITASLPQVTLAWASPITVRQAQEEGEKEHRITELIHSSGKSWLSDSTDIMPGPGGFTPEGETGARLLGVISTGSFDSFFAGRPSPLLNEKQAEEAEPPPGGEETPEDDEPVISSVIARSPESARIVLFSSSDFLRDQVIGLSGTAMGSEYLNTLDLMANTIDWSLEDAGLLGMRSRGHFNRTLPPLEHSVQVFWEYANYILAALALGVIALIQRRRQRARERNYLNQLSHGEA